MKSILLMLGLTVAFVASVFGQGHKPTINPEDTFSFVKIKLTNPNGTPYANAPVVLKGEAGHQVKVMTDKNGKAKAKVPVGDTYSLHCGAHVAFRKVTVNSFPYVTYNVQGYTRRFIYFTFNYWDPAGKPLEGEEVKVTSTKTGVVMTDSTNAKGQAVFILPFDPEFIVSVNYHDKVVDLNPTDVGKEYKVMGASFSWIGTKEKKRREHIADSIARVRAMALEAKLDSLAKIWDEKTIVERYDSEIPIGFGSEELVGKLLQKKAEAYKKQLKNNPQFLEEQQKAVLAPLYRLRDKFRNKIIVTDITGSMSPYMEQVLLWHALNFMQVEGQGTKYVFFNDGDRKATVRKEIGSTGGLYFCQGKFKDFKSIIHSMRKGMEAGGGGDGPENDVEALLEASARRSKTDEVILIADNYSSMRDIELIRELKVPVRVIVCGIEDPVTEESFSSCFRSSSRSINEEYLNLAYETGGSVHTVKEDVMDLAEAQEGDSIIIAGKEYEFKYGRFVLKTKM